MVLVKPIEQSSKWLKPDFVKKNQVRRIKPIEEMKPEESEFKGEVEIKITGRVECQIEGKPVMIWGMNPTSQNSMIKLFGPDTKDWQKEVQIMIVPYSGNDSIIVDEMGTAEINKIKLSGGSGKLI